LQDESIFLVDMWPDMGKETEPEWVTTEREHFEKWRDLNKVCGSNIFHNYFIQVLKICGFYKDSIINFCGVIHLYIIEKML